MTNSPEPFGKSTKQKFDTIKDNTNHMALTTASMYIKTLI